MGEPVTVQQGPGFMPDPGAQKAAAAAEQQRIEQARLRELQAAEAKQRQQEENARQVLVRQHPLESGMSVVCSSSLGPPGQQAAVSWCVTHQNTAGVRCCTCNAGCVPHV